MEALGFERADEAVLAYKDTPDEDALSWHDSLLDGVRDAFQLAAEMERGDRSRLYFGPGQSLAFAWQPAEGRSPEFEAGVLDAVRRALAGQRK